MDSNRPSGHTANEGNIMASLDALDEGISLNPSSMFSPNIAMSGDEYVRCNRCGFGGCDIRVAGCGCRFHAVSYKDVS